MVSLALNLARVLPGVIRSAVMVSVSVIIPTFNRAHLIGRAIRSVLKQENVPLEVFVIDDGSTDDTEALLGRNFPSVNYWRQANQGPAAARNLGIEKSSGDWLAFLDSDDEWLPGKLVCQLEYFARNPEIRICQTEEIWIRNGRRVNAMKKHKKYGGFIYDQCLPLCIVSPSAVMIHRSLLEEVGLFDENYPACEDYELWLRIASRHPIGLIETPYIHKYGGHSDQRSREFEAMDRFRIQALQKILREGFISESQRNATLNMLETKVKIFAAGARKRKKYEEADWAETLLRSEYEIK